MVELQSRYLLSNRRWSLGFNKSFYTSRYGISCRYLRFSTWRYSNTYSRSCKYETHSPYKLVSKNYLDTNKLCKVVSWIQSRTTWIWRYLLMKTFSEFQRRDPRTHVNVKREEKFPLTEMAQKRDYRKNRLQKFKR